MQKIQLPLVTAVVAVGMTVGDMDSAVSFYSKVLSFNKISEGFEDSIDSQELEHVPGAKARVVRMRLGHTFIDLTQYLSPKGKPVPTDSMSNDLWFQHIAIVVSDMEKAYGQLRQNGVRGISDGPQRLPRWNKQAADIEAYYFKDPEGQPLELLHFPVGKGDPQWHEGTSALFLGIDHTAIAAGNTDQSLRFYRSLGFQERGHSLNYGVEQEHLSGVAGARVRITSLRAPSGPGIELLEYENPKTGRRMPADEQANDLIHHQTILMTNEIRRTIETLCRAQVRFVSVGVSCERLSTREPRHRVLIRDPDGHGIEVIDQ
jgi:catechol 2,3-dioxygenase-like lactoylglutathione lyase family enzyme